jgi:bifunctional DNA-binding transcriptional regulator/antitoxin component of YhaV-PrlF toxin-antitoxin module
MLVRAIVSTAIVVCALSTPLPASAKATGKVSYKFSAVWPVMIRFLRIDEGHKIEEKDMEGGYIVFLVKSDGKEFRGTVEIGRVKDDWNREASMLIVKISERPQYMEQSIIERVGQKLRGELGEPQDPQDPPPEPEPAPGDVEKDGNQPPAEEPRSASDRHLR